MDDTSGSRTPMPQRGLRLPPGDPMALPHLLGEDWQSVRWFDSAAARDAALEHMRRQPAWYRKGDAPSVVLERIDPPTGG